MLERLQKILSARGIASRRKAEEYIEQGLVKVNGLAAKVGDKADPETDRIEVDGRVLQARADMLYYLFHKPVGVVTSNVDRSAKKPSHTEDVARGFEVTASAMKRLHTKASAKAKEDAVPTVRDLLPKALQGKVFPVGRLDKDSSGLLLLTNDGVLAYRLTHPKFNHEKEYEVTVKDPVKEASLTVLRAGLMIDGTKTKPARVERVSQTAFRITLTEGRYRQIRRMAERVGATVVGLKRVRIMTLADNRLRAGALRLLREEEKKKLLKSAGVE